MTNKPENQAERQAGDALHRLRVNAVETHTFQDLEILGFELFDLHQKLAEAQKETEDRQKVQQEQLKIITNQHDRIEKDFAEIESLRAELAKEKQRILFDQDAAEKLSKCGAEVEVLKQELATNKAAREWIRVEDSLPSNNHNVLVRHSGGHAYGHLTGIAYRFYGGWFIRLSENQLTGVTHWMELPEPPSELRALVQQEEKK